MRVQVVANQNASATLHPGSHSRSPFSIQRDQNQNQTVVFRPRGASSASSRAPSSTGAPGPGSSASSTYSSTGSRSVAATSSSMTIRPPDPYPPMPAPADLPRTSYLHIKRRDKPISTRAVINPYLPKPLNPQIDVGEEDKEESSWIVDEDDDYGPRFGTGPSLPGVGAGDSDKRNVSLLSKNANINAELWLVGRSPDGGVDDAGLYGRKKAGIDVRSKNGFIRIKLVKLLPSPLPLLLQTPLTRIASTFNSTPPKPHLPSRFASHVKTEECASCSHAASPVLS